MTSLPPALLEQLLTELSSLASVYHKPPESFVGKGRFGTDEIQRAAIQEQREEAAENPIAASAVAAAANGTSQNNIENLLDIDFDGGAPASAEHGAAASTAATPDRVASPTVAGGASGGMADMMGLFDMPAAGSSSSTPAPPMGGGGMNDIMNGFGDMNLGGASAPPPPGQQLNLTTPGSQNQSGGGGDDLLGLF